MKKKESKRERKKKGNGRRSRRRDACNPETKKIQTGGLKTR